MVKIFLVAAAVIGSVGCGSHAARRAVDPSQDAVLVSRAPEFHEVTLDAGTVLSVTLENSVASNMNRVEDRVRGRLSQPVVVDNMPVLPRGSLVDGVVSDVRRSGQVVGLARLEVNFDTLVVEGTTYNIATSSLARVAPGTKATEPELATPGKDVRLRSGERLSVRLARPVTIRIPVDVI